MHSNGRISNAQIWNHHHVLTLNFLGKIVSRWHIELFFLLFPENMTRHFMQIVSIGDIICIKCQILFSGENKKNIINLLSTELAQRAVKIIRTKLRELLVCWLTLKAPVTTIVVCFVICLWFYKSFLQTVWTQIRLHLKEQSDLDPHCLPVCKTRFEMSARIFSRRHKQTFSDAVFLGALRVNGLIQQRLTYYYGGSHTITVAHILSQWLTYYHGGSHT